MDFFKRIFIEMFSSRAILRDKSRFEVGVSYIYVCKFLTQHVSCGPLSVLTKLDISMVVDVIIWFLDMVRIIQS